MSKWIASWFYVQSENEGGEYAQVGSDSSTEQFRDVYRRCLATFYLSARKANTDANLILYLNEPWTNKGTVATEVLSILKKLGVVMQIMPYTHQPPATFPKAWKNQFFVLDVMADLQTRVSPEDTWVILDSDIVWSCQPTTNDMWKVLSKDGIATYTVGYDPSKTVNGLSANDLTHLHNRLQAGEKTAQRQVEYSGGEFIGGRGDQLASLYESTQEIWDAFISMHKQNNKFVFEEAHLLSVAYSHMGIAPGSANDYIRRLWTQPFRYNNTRPEDVRLALWHVPAEKKYGLRRVYNSLSRNPDLLDECPNQWQSFLSAKLGVPTNTVWKSSLDILRSLSHKTKVRQQGRC